MMKQVEIEATLPDAQSSPFHLHCGLLLPFCLHRSMFTVSEKDISLLFHIQDLRSLRFFFLPKCESSETFIMLFSTSTCNVKSSRLKSTISTAETPEFLTFLRVMFPLFAYSIICFVWHLQLWCCLCINHSCEYFTCEVLYNLPPTTEVFLYASHSSCLSLCLSG